MITGTFIEEAKNRFLCLVEVDGELEECYVSSSSKLNNYISLQGRKVMLVENRGKNLRTKYTLQAVFLKRRWILLNLNIINELVFKTFKPAIRKRINREYFIGDYKSDFYDDSTKEIIEAKGVLSQNKAVRYPLVSCGRFLRQLTSFEKLLEQGYKVRYVFVLMNPSIREITIDKSNKEMADKFFNCIASGMEIEFWTIRWYAGNCSLKRMPQNSVIIA